MKVSKLQPRRIPGLFSLATVLSAIILGLLSTGLGAQQADAEPATDVVPQSLLLEEVRVVQQVTIDDLPGNPEVAAALADSELRTDALLTLIAVAHMLDYGTSVSQTDGRAVAARFRDDRAWVDRLTKRFHELPSRGTQLDPAAWFVYLKLDELQPNPGLYVSPLGPKDRSLMRQLFDRSNERLAAAILPEALQRAEIQSAALWSGLLASAMMNEVLLSAVVELHPDWFESWVGLAPPDVAVPEMEEAVAMAGEEEVDPEPEPLTGTEKMDRVIDEALVRLLSLANSTMYAGPFDSRMLARLRADLMTAMPRLGGTHLQDAQHILVLASAFDGLNDGKYLAFTESLLWVISDMLLTGQPGAQLPRELAELLPRLSNTYSRNFAAIDPRINATLAAAFDAVQYLQGDRSDPERLVTLRRGIGDANTQMALMVPEMDYYFDQPVRRRIADEVSACTQVAANMTPDGPADLTREQFDDCLAGLVSLSGEQANREELAGDPDGPFGEDQLRRELMMPPWQRINFAMGYMHERFTTACEEPEQPIPNPLEWSALATLVVWFARQAPVYFQTPENEALIEQMRQQGADLLNVMEQQVDCFSGEGAGINDPVVRSLVDYRQALQQLVAGIREAELEFREERLKPGADIVLHGDATQQTAWRSDDMVIGPCDPEQVCEMSGELEVTRALIGQFPDEYLIADQTGLGQVEICYENMSWVERRGEAVRPEDTYVANYYGKLSFDLVGRYLENDQVTNVFGANFVSPDEYHYLFAAATEEVAQDDCPMEWVGTKIVTGLNTDSVIRVVPDRLTYLAGARTKPSEVINANWGKGAEWRDWFVTGLGVTPHEYEPDPTLPDRINQHLQDLYKAEQAAIYTALLRPQSRSGRFDDDTLLDLQEELTARKALVRSFINLFYPDFMLDSDDIRSSLEGYDALLDTRVLRRFRESNVAIASIYDQGISRLESFQAEWSRMPEAVRRTGSVSTIVAHAVLRLNSLYAEYFALPPEPAEVREEFTPAGG